jgi:hypothetical protein
MRLSVYVNGIARSVASLPGPGYLDAHLNMHDRPKDNDRSRKLRIVGHDTSSETENVRLEWTTIDLDIGDVVELQILPEGEGDTPSEIRRSSESDSNLFSNPDLAKELLHLVGDYETRLMNLVEKSKTTESDEEHKKLIKAVGAVLYEHGAQLLYPVYRRHKELVPESLKGELL